jgi:hypothetical protein
MRKAIYGVCALFAFGSMSTGCESIRQRQFARDQQFCSSIGATGAAFTNCMMMRDQANRQAAAQYADIAQQAIQQQTVQQPRVVNTTCQRIGYTDVRCTTF